MKKSEEVLENVTDVSTLQKRHHQCDSNNTKQHGEQKTDEGDYASGTESTTQPPTTEFHTHRHHKHTCTIPRYENNPRRTQTPTIASAHTLTPHGTRKHLVPRRPKIPNKLLREKSHRRKRQLADPIPFPRSTSIRATAAFGMAAAIQLI